MKLRNASEGYELPLTCDVLVDDINWVIATDRDPFHRKAVYDRKIWWFCPGDYFKSYHTNPTHRTIDQMMSKL